ncbi:hypothetical protein [Parvibaculum sp.]|uniref:hypothetical protein n=1 Tax=Parvibaculum sp. TaxID=2024848 RepID=UPI00320EA0E2
MVGRIVLRRMFGAVGKVSSGAGEAPSARSIGVRCNAGRPLLLSTALGTGILVGAAGLTLGSTQALAACTGNTSGTATCDGTITDQGIDYTATGSLVVELIGANITETQSGTNGVAVDGNGHPVQVVFMTDGNTTNVSATDGTAISVVSNGGGVGVNTADINWVLPYGANDKQNTISGSEYGIFVAQTNGASSGDANVTIGDDTVSGGTDAGIGAVNAGSGNINISAGAGSTVSSTFSDGINTSANSGNTTITTGTGSNVSSSSSFGIQANSGSGNIGITTNGTVSAGGIYAGSTSGNIGITTNDAVNGRIDAYAGGSGTVTITTNDDVTSASDAINANGVNGLIKVTANGNIDAGSKGIGATSAGSGNIEIVTGTDSAIAADGDGINAVSSNTGTGAITITSNGTIGTSLDPVGDDGIQADIQNAVNGSAISITANKSIYATNNGIIATTLGTGNVDVTAGASTVISGASGAGISATAAGAGGTVTVTANGTSITGSTDGIYAQNLTGNIVVDVNSGTVTGTGSGGEGIYATTGGAGKITITQDAGTTVNSTSDDGIEAVSNGTGLIHITSNGTIIAGNNGGDDGITAIGLNGGAPITIDFGTGNVDASITAAGNGIEAQNSGSGKITVNAYGTIANTAGDLGANGGTLQNNESGIWTKQIGTGDIEINTGTKSISAGIGQYDYGIYAQAGGGSIDITTGTGKVTGGDDGIHAEVLGGDGNIDITTGGEVTSLTNIGIYALYSGGGAGDITVTNNGTVGNSTTATAGSGIVATNTNGGTGNVTVVANASIYATNDGIAASNAGSGKVDVTAGASTVIAATSGAGITASGAGGTVTVTANGTSITGSTVGIQASNTTGNIVVDVNSGTVTGTGSSGEGIYATTGDVGTITITQDAGTTVNSTTDDGIEAVSTGTGLIHITSNGTITAGDNGGDDGITAIGLAGGAPITIDFGTGNVDASITAAGNGIEAQTSSSGKITVNAYGTIANKAGDLGANGSTRQNNESGIWTKQTGTGDIEINTGTKSISAGNNLYDYGIYAQAANGSVTITTGTGTVTGGDDGIHAEVLSGSATATVTANGNVTSTVGSAIDVRSDTGSISITNYGAATTSSIVPVVLAATNGGSVTINNKASGSISASGATPAWDALAIQTSTGAGTVTVQNDGNITGRVDFNLASTGGATFNNTANTWYTSGVNNFTAGNDTLTNTSTGDIHTSGTTTFAFGAGTDAVNNAGDFFVSGDTSFTGLEAFNNSGILDLSTDHTVTTDTVTIDGAFNGTGVSELVLDAALGWPASADLLTVGSTTGSTAIRINNVASGFGAWLGSDFMDGILLVDGSSSAASFHLDTTQELYDASIDALDAGLFNYKLVFNSGQERLISLPGEEASQLPTFLTAAQSIWYDTSPWLDRQADLRDQLKGGEGSVTPGIWGKALGRWASRDLSQTVSAGGTSITNNVDYDQDTYGFVAGVDTGSSNVLGQGDTLLGGVSAGYVTSDQNFKTSPTTAEYKGAVLGVYGTYLKGGFFIDAMAKANLLTMDYKAPSLGGATASPDVKSYGVEVDAGQRFPLSDSAFIEPLASLTYAKTQIDTFSVANSQFDFQDATSFRGSLGLRGGATAYQSSETKVDLSLTGRLWNEFEGDNKMVIRSGGPDLTMTDKFDGTFGEVVGSVNIFGLGDGLSGFVNGGAKFKSNYTSGELTAGIRYEW